MASLREYRKKIKSVKSTQQITKAMKMVAAARVRRAQSRILSARPYALKMRELLADLAGRILWEDSALPPPHPLLCRRETGAVALLLVTSDKGLCGSFNANLIRRTSEFLRANEGREIQLFVVGRKGRDFFRRMGFDLRGEYLQITNQLSYTHAEIIGSDLIRFYQREPVSEVVVIYNEFKSLIQQKLVQERLLPVERPAVLSAEQRLDFIYEPERAALLDELLPRCVKSQIFRILLESSAAELGARMAAMDAASKNARELIDSLTLRLNRTRQAIITREIAELVGGAEALK